MGWVCLKWIKPYSAPSVSEFSSLSLSLCVCVCMCIIMEALFLCSLALKQHSEAERRNWWAPKLEESELLPCRSHICARPPGHQRRWWPPAQVPSWHPPAWDCDESKFTIIDTQAKGTTQLTIRMVVCWCVQQHRAGWTEQEQFPVGLGCQGSERSGQGHSSTDYPVWLPRQLLWWRKEQLWRSLTNHGSVPMHIWWQLILTHSLLTINTKRRM